MGHATSRRQRRRRLANGHLCAKIANRSNRTETHTLNQLNPLRHNNSPRHDVRVTEKSGTRHVRSARVAHQHCRTPNRVHTMLCATFWLADGKHGKGAHNAATFAFASCPFWYPIIVELGDVATRPLQHRRTAAAAAPQHQQQQYRRSVKHDPVRCRHIRRRIDADAIPIVAEQKGDQSGGGYVFARLSIVWLDRRNALHIQAHTNVTSTNVHDTCSVRVCVCCVRRCCGQKFNDNHYYFINAFAAQPVSVLTTRNATASHVNYIIVMSFTNEYICEAVRKLRDTLYCRPHDESAPVQSHSIVD